jgi:immunoglobulin-like protein involved in spore germination
MIRRLIFLAVLALATAACGSGGHKAATTTTTPTTTTQAQPMQALTVFEVVDGALHARTAHVERTPAVAAAALGALGIDAPVTIADGTATVKLDSATPEQTAEVVYTLTQFPTVKRVDVGGRSGLTRADVLAFVPPILIETPAANAEVPQTFTVSGTASVFEATLVVELRQGGHVAMKRTVTASNGAPERGTFSTTLTAPKAGAATVAAYAPSAADGSPQHEQDVPVTVTP